MPVLLKLDWSNWLYGLFAGFIGGGAGAVISGVTASMFAPDKLAVGGTKFFEFTGIVFLAHGLISMFMYLQQNPLPKQITVTSEKSTSTSTETTTTVIPLPPVAASEQGK
jgi:hypothetical protein